MNIQNGSYEQLLKFFFSYNMQVIIIQTTVSTKVIPPDKVCMYEEIMTNDDNLESNLLSSSLLKMCSLYKLNWRFQVIA